jgi:Fur family ferric uptake transcriptional regulator
LAALERYQGFVSAQELHGSLLKHGESVALATVYSQLKKLAEGHEVDVVMTDRGESLYRRCVVGSHHHHLSCRRCGATVEVEVPELERWANDDRRSPRLRGRAPRYRIHGSM